MSKTTFPHAPLGVAVQQTSNGVAPIKGKMQSEPAVGAFPAFSASGQDVWVPAKYANLSGAGLVVSAVGARCGKVFHADFERWGVTANTVVLKPSPGASVRFLWYLLNNENFWIKGGTAQPYVQFDRSFQKRVPLPPLQTQRRIADYLDRETGEIDEMIDKLDDLAETLETRRDKEILQNALQGFNPFTDGGSPLGASFDVLLGKMLDARRKPLPGDVNLPYIRAANISDPVLDLADVNTMPFTPYEVENLNLLAGDLLVVEGGSVGECALLQKDMSGWSYQKTVNRVRSIDGSSTAWLGYVLRAYRGLGVISTIVSGTTIAHLTAEKLRALRVPAIKQPEQRRIADHLDDVTSKIDAMLAKVAQLKDLLTERRAALITDVVTGRKEVA